VTLHASKGRSSRRIAEALRCYRSWVSRVVARWQQVGPAGLLDGREDNGPCKLSEAYPGRLDAVVRRRPTDFGYSRPTRTRELLVQVLERETGVRVHVGTFIRALQWIGARRGRPVWP
jgi:transposase